MAGKQEANGFGIKSHVYRNCRCLANRCELTIVTAAKRRDATKVTTKCKSQSSLHALRSRPGGLPEDGSFPSRRQSFSVPKTCPQCSKQKKNCGACCFESPFFGVSSSSHRGRRVRTISIAK